MQTIMDAASHIAEEIERTRLHLANLEQALEGLKPLMTIDVSSTTLFFSQVGEAQPVEDAFIVNVAKPKSRVDKPLKPQKVQAEKAATTASSKVDEIKPKDSPKPKVGNTATKTATASVKSAGTPPTGAEFWMKLVGRKAFGSGELTDAALEKLSLDASSKGVIANRARAWITAALKKGVLLTAGTRNGINLYKRA